MNLFLFPNWLRQNFKEFREYPALENFKGRAVNLLLNFVDEGRYQIYYCMYLLYSTLPLKPIFFRSLHMFVSPSF